MECEKELLVICEHAKLPKIITLGFSWIFRQGGGTRGGFRVPVGDDWRNLPSGRAGPKTVLPHLWNGLRTIAAFPSSQGKYK